MEVNKINIRQPLCAIRYFCNCQNVRFYSRWKMIFDRNRIITKNFRDTLNILNKMQEKKTANDKISIKYSNNGFGRNIIEMTRK